MYTSKVGRKKKSPDELMINLSAKVSPEFFREVETVAIENDRMMSYIGRKLLARGLAAYKRDGLLDEPEVFDEALERDIASMRAGGAIQIESMKIIGKAS